MKYLIELDEKLNQDLRENDTLCILIMSNTIFNASDQVISIPAKAVVELSIRAIPEFDNAEVITLFKETAKKYNQDGADIKVDVTVSLPSVYTYGIIN